MHMAKLGHDFDKIVSHLSSRIFANVESLFNPVVSFASIHASNAFPRYIRLISLPFADADLPLFLAESDKYFLFIP